MISKRILRKNVWSDAKHGGIGQQKSPKGWMPRGFGAMLKYNGMSNAVRKIRFDEGAERQFI